MAQFIATPLQVSWSEGPALVVLNSISGFKKKKKKEKQNSLLNIQKSQKPLEPQLG